MVGVKALTYLFGGLNLTYNMLHPISPTPKQDWGADVQGEVWGPFCPESLRLCVHHFQSRHESALDGWGTQKRLGEEEVPGHDRPRNSAFGKQGSSDFILDHDSCVHSWHNRLFCFRLSQLSSLSSFLFVWIIDGQKFLILCNLHKIRCIKKTIVIWQMIS